MKISDYTKYLIIDTQLLGVGGAVLLSFCLCICVLVCHISGLQRFFAVSVGCWFDSIRLVLFFLCQTEAAPNVRTIRNRGRLVLCELFTLYNRSFVRIDGFEFLLFCVLSAART